MEKDEIIKWLRLIQINLGHFPEISNEKKIEALAEAIRLLKNEQSKEPMVEIDLYSVIKQKYIEREVLDKIRAEIIKYEGNCRLSVDEYPSCKQCTDNVFETIYAILDKYKGESEEE